MFTPREFPLHMQEAYLDHLRETGQRDLAAASVSRETRDIDHFLEHDDPDGDFADAVAWALQLYQSDLVYKIEKAAVEGQESKRFDKDGNQVSSEVKYETSLRAKVLERYGAGYKGEPEQESEKGTGVLVLPAVVESADQWAERVATIKGLPKVSTG